MRNPRSRYVRMKQARKACLHCGSTDVRAFLSTQFRCRTCAHRRWNEGRGGAYGAYTR